MALLLPGAAAWLAETLAAAGGETITYVRGGLSLSVVAVVSTARPAADGDHGYSVQWQVTDFLVAKADFTLGTPRRGDRILRTVAGATRAYEVLGPAELPVAELDTHASRWRIHTKEILTPWPLPA